MFNVVSAKKRYEFEDDMNQMFERLNVVLGEKANDKYDHDQAIYVLYSHKKFGVIGSARLIPAGCGAITEDYLRRIKYDSKNRIYEVSRVFFNIPKDQNVTESNEMFDVIRRDFYQGLYEALKTISIAQKVKTFVSVLSTEEHQDVQKYGLWSFDKQGRIKLPHLGDDFSVVGILPMSEVLYEKFLDRRMSYEMKLNQRY